VGERRDGEGDRPLLADGGRVVVAHGRAVKDVACSGDDPGVRDPKMEPETKTRLRLF